MIAFLKAHYIYAVFAAIAAYYLVVKPKTVTYATTASSNPYGGPIGMSGQTLDTMGPEGGAQLLAVTENNASYADSAAFPVDPKLYHKVTDERWSYGNWWATMDLMNWIDRTTGEVFFNAQPPAYSVPKSIDVGLGNIYETTGPAANNLPGGVNDPGSPQGGYVVY